MSGFGRTGKWFGVQNHGVVPDLMVMAKGITAGYLPLGGVMVSDEIAEYFNKVPLPLGLTHYAHPVCLAAANEVLDIYEDDNLVENARSMGKYLEYSMGSFGRKTSLYWRFSEHR